jgi:CRISPR/Cas system-associated protein Cas10 (large subunit of type III CRISPR-Cas system)
MPIYRRKGDGSERGVLSVLLLRYLQLIISLSVVTGLAYGGLTHFASAQDVRRNYSQLSLQIEEATLGARKERYEDELFRLRNLPDSSQNAALIQRYVAKLDDINQRLRDIDRAKRSVK